MSAYVPGFENDVFISYEHAEDPTWIQTFVKSLSDQLSSQHGIKASIWQDKKELDVGENWEAEIEEGIKRSAILLAVLSPGYKNSEWCMKECEIFKEFLASRGEQFEKSNRFFKVVKTPWEDDEHLDFWAAIEHLELFRRNDRNDIEPF
ncbi:MAG: toll/interleukin-1 receptor domain-containing protein, partial [Thermoanaerobaculia bacterium]